ncbi:MAG TPA: tandem-95 repeat protein, partial [Gaiellaceae bacterium]
MRRILSFNAAILDPFNASAADARGAFGALRPFALRLLVAIALVAAASGVGSGSAQAYNGDGTYQWWFNKYGCTYTRTLEGGIQTSGQVTGSWDVQAQTVGGKKIGWIHLEAWAVGLSDNGLWVHIANTKTDLSNTWYMSGKRTEGVRFRWSVNQPLTNITTMPTQVAMVYKISWRRFYGKWGHGVWKTKKKTADFIEPTRLAGNVFLSDVKHYVWGGSCSVRNVGSAFRARASAAGPTSGALVGGTAVATAALDVGAAGRTDGVETADAKSMSAVALLELAQSSAGLDRSFEGLSSAEAPGPREPRGPPEPALAVGPDRVLIAGGGMLSVLDSATGARLGDPIPAAALWAGGGGPCTVNPEDPRVAAMYDEEADRYVVARAASSLESGSQALACLAVSTSGDPRGDWHTSQAELGAGLELSDVRVAGWPSAYVVTTTASPLADSSGEGPGDPAVQPPVSGSQVVAFKRDAALAGTAVPAIVRAPPLADGIQSLAPADSDAGGLLDPAAPVLLVATNGAELLLYRFSIDWDDLGASSISPPVAVAGAPILETTECMSPCAQQPSPGELLDVAAGRVGLRPVVHSDGAGSLRLAVAVSADAPFWVDIDAPWGETPTAHSSGAVASQPGAVAFQPSIVADSGGGFLVVAHGSGSDVAPGPQYEAIGPGLGSSGSFSATAPGSAPQTAGAGFGPDTAAVKDPVDPCRVWLAGQEQRTVLAGDWSVRVASVRSPSCAAEPDGAPTASFSATPVRGAAPLTVSFDAGGSSDPEGASLEYAWAFGDGATGAGAGPTHTFDSEGLYRVRLVVTDPGGHSATMTRLIEVVDDDRQPVAGADQLSTKVGIQVAGDLIAGPGTPPSDYDPDGGPVRIQDSTSPSHGTVACDSAGPCVYTPDPGFSGSDAFDYTLADDEGNTVTGHVFVEVANRPPQPEDDGLEAGSGTPATLNVLENDSEFDPADSLFLVSNTSPSHGTADCSGDGTCTYVSDPGFVGTDRFEYTASDGEAEASTWVDVFVASCPDLSTAIGNGSTLITGWEWVLCASHEAHDETTLSPAGLDRTGPAALMTSGAAALASPPNIAPDTGVDLETEARGAFDASVLRLDLQVPEGASCLGFDAVFASDEYPEYVGSPFNDAFLAELDESDWVVEGETISAPHNFAVDQDGRVLSVNSVLFSGVVTQNGTEYDGSTPPIRVQTPITPGPHSLYLSIFDASDHILDSAAFIDNLVAGVTPVGGCRSGVNEKPVALPDAAVTLEDVPATVNVLANDSDNDGSLVPSTLRVVSPPASGVASVADGKITYAPAPNVSGAFTLTYEICDDGGACATSELTVTVIPVNDPPIASFIAVPDHGSPPLDVSFDASASSDPDSAIVAYEWVFGDGPTGSGVTPAHTFSLSGTYEVQLTVQDAQGATGTTTGIVEVAAAANLSVAKDDSPDPVTIGEELTYTLTVDNFGPSAAEDVVVTDTLPAGV